MSFIFKIFIFLIIFSSNVSAHKDRLINLKENGDLEGLPDIYQPASLNLEDMRFQVGKVIFTFPECVSKYFPTNKKYTLAISSSWYHTRSTLPPYITLIISPIDKDYTYRLLFELGSLKPIEFYLITKIDETSTTLHTLKIGENCQNSIKGSYSNV